jgi:putative FmdB family regulatory protein
MPTYEYSCPECKARSFVTRGINEDAAVSSCETCGIPFKRVYSSVGVTFSGSGFYRTDNRR